MSDTQQIDQEETPRLTWADEVGPETHMRRQHGEGPFVWIGSKMDKNSIPAEVSIYTIVTQLGLVEISAMYLKKVE